MEMPSTVRDCYIVFTGLNESVLGLEPSPHGIDVVPVKCTDVRVDASESEPVRKRWPVTIEDEIDEEGEPEAEEEEDDRESEAEAESAEGVDRTPLQRSPRRLGSTGKQAGVQKVREQNKCPKRGASRYKCAEKNRAFTIDKEAEDFLATLGGCPDPRSSDCQHFNTRISEAPPRGEAGSLVYMVDLLAAKDKASRDLDLELFLLMIKLAFAAGHYKTGEDDYNKLVCTDRMTYDSFRRYVERGWKLARLVCAGMAFFASC